MGPRPPAPTVPYPWQGPDRFEVYEQEMAEWDALNRSIDRAEWLYVVASLLTVPVILLGAFLLFGRC